MTEMERLKRAYSELNAVWIFYKHFALHEPKGMDFYHDLAIESGKLELKTRFGRYCLKAAISAISEDDYIEKNGSYQMNLEDMK